MALHAYLFFTGTAREAMTRYQEILGGELEVMTFGEMPDGEEPPPFEVDPASVLHAALTLPDGSLLMGSDDPTGDGAGVKGAALSLDLADPDGVPTVFDALAAGGEIGMPLGATFWSPLFGMCTDRFGVSWMVSLATEPSDPSDPTGAAGAAEAS